jgi:hypothetical protein
MYQGPALPLRGFQGGIGVLREVMNCPTVSHGEETGRSVRRSRSQRAPVEPLSAAEKGIRLAREIAKLSPEEEKRMAEEGLGVASWPSIETRGLMGDLEFPVYRADCT